jgi:BarA-like signal transduction histidine kinase
MISSILVFNLLTTTPLVAAITFAALHYHVYWLLILTLPVTVITGVVGTIIPVKTREED